MSVLLQFSLAFGALILAIVSFVLGDYCGSRDERREQRRRRKLHLDIHQSN